MAHKFGFLLLPRELRDIIYVYYVDEGGYLFNHESGKLRTAKNEPIDLVLASTCRQVAVELDGLALQTNVITFTTISSKDSTCRAYRLHYTWQELNYTKLDIVNSSRHLISKHSADQITQTFPTSSALVRSLVELPPLEHGYTHFSHAQPERLWDPAPSTFREFYKFTIDQLSVEPKFTAAADGAMRYSDIDDNSKVGRLLAIPICAWSIPTNEELDELEAVITPPEYVPSPEDRMKWYFSAAAVSVYFLTMLPPHTRAHVRNIRLNEHYKSVADPECHGKGLIPFCRENPYLRVTRHVDLWRALCSFEIPSSVRNPNYTWLGHLEINDFVSSMRKWLDEAFSLPQAGMPSESFSLVLDAPSNDLRIMFDILKRTALWQEAFEKSFRRQIAGHSAGEAEVIIRTHACHVSDMFVNVMRSLVENPTSLVNFNVMPGDPWDIEPLLEQSREWSVQDWTIQYERLSPRALCPDTSMPSWREIQLEYAYDTRTTS